MKTLLAILLCFVVALPASAQRFVKVVGTTNELMAQPVPDIHSVTLLKGYVSSNENLNAFFQYIRASAATPNGISIFTPTFGGGVGRYHRLLSEQIQQTNFTLIVTNVTVIVSSNLTFITTNLTFITTNTTNFGWTFINASTTNTFFTTNLFLLSTSNLTANADRVVDLVNLPITIPFASLGGYTARGDGGGGDFVLTNSTTLTNLGTRIASATAGYSWDRVYAGPVQVPWFGASTNAVESRGPIQNALTNGFPHVHFPKGRYVVNGALTPVSNQIVSGDGDNSTITQTGALASTIAGTNLTSVTVRGLRFVGLADDSLGQAADACNGVYLLTSTNLVVTSCTFSNHSSHGVFFNICKDGLISDNRFDLAGWPSGVNKNTTTANYQIGDIRLANATQRIAVRGNHHFSEANFGVELNTDVGVGGTCAYNTIEGNFLRGHLKYAVILYINTGGVVTKNIISGNFISDMPGLTAGNDGTYSQTAGIYIQSAEDNSIIGNHLSNIGLFTTGQSVPPGAISANGASSILIADNRITNSYTRGITVFSAVDPTGVATVSRNYIVDTGRVRINGSISSGSPLLTVSSTNGFVVGNTVVVAGAGIAGANLTTTIITISGVVFTLAANASTTVSGAGVEKSVAWEGGIVILNRNRVKAAGNVIHNTYSSGIYANFASQFLEVNDNTISSPQTYGIFISGSFTNSQINRNVITITNTLGSGIALADTNHLVQIKGNTIFGGSAGTAISTGVGNPFVIQNTIQGALAGIQSTTTNIFDNIFDGVTTPYSGASFTSLDRPVHLHSSLWVSGNATNNRLWINGASEQLIITPMAETAYDVVRLNNAAGTRRLELVYVGTGAAAAYGIPAGGVGLNAGGGTLNFSTSDLLRWSINSSGAFESPGAGNVQANGRLDISTLSGNGDLFLTTHGTGKIHVNSVPASSILALDAGQFLTNLTVGSGLSLVGNTLSTTGGGGVGTVTSVALTMPSPFTVTGSPVTSSGTLAVSATDPGADRLVGFDNTDNDIRYMVIGAGLNYDAATDTLTSTAVGTGGGDVVGPASATDNALARYDGATGKLIQNSSVILDDVGWMSGVTNLTVTTRITNSILTASSIVASDANKALKSVTIGANLTFDGTTLAAAGAGTGDFVGPAGATDNALVRFDTTTGKLGQDSSAILTDAGALSVAALTVSGGITNIQLTANRLVLTDSNQRLSSLADPNANRIIVWDDTDNLIRNAVLGVGLVYTPATDTLSVTNDPISSGTDFSAVKILTQGSEVSVFEIAMPSNSSVAIQVEWSVESTDGVDFETNTGVDFIAGGSKAGFIGSNFARSISSGFYLTHAGPPPTFDGDANDLSAGKIIYTQTFSSTQLTPTSITFRYRVKNFGGKVITQL